MKGHRDPTCRFARWNPEHGCVNANGDPCREGVPCAVEARMQVIEQTAARLRGEPETESAA